MSEDKQSSDEDEYTGKPLIIQVEPNVVNNSLFKDMSYQSNSQDKLEVEQEVEELKGIPKQVVTFMDLLTKNYFGTLLGGQIIDPMYAKGIVLDRIIQFTEMLMGVYIQQVDKLLSEIDHAKITGENIEDKVNNMLELIETYFITLREIMNRLETTVHINARPEVRPPLVDAKIGYQKLQY